MRIIVNLGLSALAFYVVAYLVPGVVIAGWPSLIVASVVWGILSILVKPVLVILTLPITIVTLGLFSFVINALLLLVLSAMVDGFEVSGFMTALVAAVVLALVNMILSRLK